MHPNAENLPQQCLEHGLATTGAWRLTGYLGFEEPVSIGHGVTLWSSTIGAFSYARDFVSMRNVDLGRYCSVAVQAVLGVDQHPTDGLSTSSSFYTDSFFAFDKFRPSDELAPVQRTLIGSDVWIGVDSLIMPGITIGDGAVVGAKSVVTKNVEPFAIVAGVPAKPIRMRFPDPMIERLIKLKWWDYSIREWCSRHAVRTIPLNEAMLSRLEESILCGDLAPITARRHIMIPTEVGYEFRPI